MEPSIIIDYCKFIFKKNAWNKVNRFFCVYFFSFALLFTSIDAYAKLAARANLNQTAVNSTNDKASITKVFTLKQLGWKNEISLNGYQPNYSLYVSLHPQGFIQKVILHLKVFFSPQLSSDTRVDVKLNQNVIRSLYKPAINEASWDIELPLNQLNGEWQAIVFSAYLHSALRLCSPEIWVYISPESTLTINYLPTPFVGKLSQLPSPIIEPNAVDPGHAMLLLPPNPFVLEVISLFRIALKMGQLVKDSPIQITTGYMNEINPQESKANHFLLIGLANKILESPFIKNSSVLKTEVWQTALSNHYGIIALLRSPFNPMRAVLTFTGANNSALEKAVNAFIEPEFSSIAGGQIAYIEQLKIASTPKRTAKRYQATYKELGYGDQSVSGLGQHRLSYTIALPNNRIPQKAIVKTYITAPIFKGNDYSHITLLVNGIKQSSFQITKEQSAWIANIQTDALKPGKNKLEYLINLHLAKENCSRENYDELWATLHAESSFAASFFNAFPKAMISQFPVPLSLETNIILPAGLSKEAIRYLTPLFFKLGQLFDNSAQIINIYLSNEIDEKFIRGHDVIIIGTPKQNPWAKFVLNFLPVQLNGHARLIKFQKKQMQLSNNHAVGLLELVQSPWSEEHAAFLITGSNEDALGWAIKAFTNDQVRMKTNGNIAFVNSDLTVDAMNSYDDRYLSMTHRIALKLANWQRNFVFYLFNYPQFIVYFLALLVPLIILYRRRNK